MNEGAFFPEGQAEPEPQAAHERVSAALASQLLGAPFLLELGIAGGRAHCVGHTFGLLTYIGFVIPVRASSPPIPVNFNWDAFTYTEGPYRVHFWGVTGTVFGVSGQAITHVTGTSTSVYSTTSLMKEFTRKDARSVAIRNAFASRVNDIAQQILHQVVTQKRASLRQAQGACS